MDSIVCVIEVNGRKFNVYTLGAYNTPYYYTKELGGRRQFPTILRLKNAIKRALESGKLK